MMTHQEMIDVIQHHMKGGKVECRDIESGTNWVIPSHIDSGGFNFGSYDYRAKPEPQVLWVAICKSDVYFATISEQEIERYVETSIKSGLTIKKFIEEI